jgi:hypothetical protein
MAAVEAVDPAAGHRSIIEVPNSRRARSLSPNRYPDFMMAMTQVQR